MNHPRRANGDPAKSRRFLQVVASRSEAARAADPGETIIVLRGEYDIARRSELKHLFGECEEGPLTVDMSQVQYVDSCFFSELARLRSSDAARSITIAGARESIRRLFEIVAMDTLFRIVP